MPVSDAEFTEALHEGDPEKVLALIASGANVRYRDENGYDALIDAVHGRDVATDDRLIALLRALIAAGVEPSAVTTYGESGLRVLSRLGRFDAVSALLELGADKSHLGWTPLIEAVAVGSLADVEARIDEGANLEGVDWWSRTAWLMALLVGDLAKAKRLLAAGANANARGRCGAPALAYAIQGRHPDVVRWLLEGGQDVEGADEFGTTPLMVAVDQEDLECVEILLTAGADIARDANGTAFSRATTPPVATRLLDAGADPKDLSYEARRALVGLPPDPDEGLLTASTEDFRRAPTRRFGRANPERIQEPFWESMIRAGVGAYAARQRFDPTSARGSAPVWCAQRFGQSLTFLPDGRIVQIGGEHEDYYDADFCIYNDVFVHGADGSIAIYGYPEADFAPTDFHTATRIGDHIYVIGSAGYAGSRRVGETSIHRLDTRTFRMDRLEATGEAPGWIYGHRAVLVGPQEIRVFGGKIVQEDGGMEDHAENAAAFALDIEQARWRRLAA